LVMEEGDGAFVEVKTVDGSREVEVKNVGERDAERAAVTGPHDVVEVGLGRCGCQLVLDAGFGRENRGKQHPYVSVSLVEIAVIRAREGQPFLTCPL
jgi:hypothetical protein